MYEQPDLPLDQVALINRNTNETFIYVFLYLRTESVFIQSIDGKPVKAKGFSDKLTLLPGQHEIAAYYSEAGGGPTADAIEFHANLVIDVKAGQEYQIRGGVKEDVVRIWVEDLETKTVAGMSSMIVEK
jgi:hypothetical protein